MKLYSLIKIFFLVIISIFAQAQVTNLSVTGHVFDIGTGEPIDDQDVTVIITGNGLTNTYEYISNEQGFWGSDSLSASSQGTVYALTYDCNQQPVEFLENYSSNLNNFTFDFYICQDTVPVNDCENWFQYITNDYWTFQFSGNVIPDGPAMFSWDFGDGTFGTDQEVSHVFEPTGVSFYTVCLTTYSTGFFEDTCLAISCQDVYVGNLGGDCINWFTFEQINAFTFQFNGESSPNPAEIYNWNFGDGQNGWGQNVIHSFDPGLGQQFLVQLTTISFDPATADSCFAYSDQWVSISNIPDCEADYYFIQDTLLPLDVQFFDNSTGPVTNWLWNFGDGSSSFEINPTHSFPGPGNYYVCLTIITDSLGLFCSDTHCEEISIISEIQADFTFVLDTVSGLSRNYYFNDLSAWQPQEWLWDFGDGNSSTQQNPVYQFTESGPYNVCLHVTKYFPNGGNISDDQCKEVTVPDYFDIGGLAFIGNTPINNPASTGDTGIAYLYRKFEQTIVAVDTNYFYEYGYYWFSDVREGNHLVKVALTENSEHFNSFAPAYYEQQLYWGEAEILQVQDSNVYYANVNLPELPGTNAGIGAITGNIVDLPNPSMSDFVYDQPVFLYSSSDELLAYQRSNFMGSFAFENLAFGTYKMVTDVTGFYSLPITVVIDQSNPVYNNALLEIYESTPNEIPEQIFNPFRSGQVYPNPVSDQINIDVDVYQEMNLITEVYNLIGQKVFTGEFNLQPGSNTVSLSTQQMEAGMYFIIIQTDTKQFSQSYKFLRK
jgi:PKD repeat protein